MPNQDPAPLGPSKNTETFVGEVILESLKSSDCLIELTPYLAKARVANVPDESISTWHINRYRLPTPMVSKIARVIEAEILPEWYVHFISECSNALVVIMTGKTFVLPKVKDQTWNAMLAYGDTVGVARRWTENIPASLPD